MSAIGLLGCAQARTDRYCRQAAEERTKNEASVRVFPKERFLEACRKLPPDDAQCTVPSFAGSAPVLAAKECDRQNPAVPKDILLGP